MFATDRDLLALEPVLFREVVWAGQRLVRGLSTIVGTTLTLTSQDNDFEDAGVDTGHVVVVDGSSYEVLSRTSSLVAEVSRIRDDPAGAAIEPTPVISKATEVVTFSPQIALVHRQILRMLGMDEDAPVEEGVLREDAVTNPGALRLIESLGALHLVWSSASAVKGFGSPESRRAEHYRRRFETERQRVAVLVDTDGDGLPEATRRLNVSRFIRG